VLATGRIKFSAGGSCSATPCLAVDLHGKLSASSLPPASTAYYKVTLPHGARTVTWTCSPGIVRPGFAVALVGAALDIRTAWWGWSGSMQRLGLNPGANGCHDRCECDPVTSLIMSFVFCTLTVCGFLLASEPVAHWFVIPVLFCGIVIGCDAADWVRGRLPLFDPAGIIGLLGVHFFFLAPLLHVTWDSWMLYIDPPPDWRDWLGGMALVNAAGLLLYRAGRRRMAVRRPTVETETSETETIWHIDTKRLLVGSACGLAVSAALQLWVYASHGGLAGYVDAFAESIGGPQSERAFIGMGWVFMLSESFPIVAMIAFASWAARTRIWKSWVLIILVMVGYLVLKMLFGGLRGNRSNTIWGMFWAVGIIHLWIRPLNRKVIFVGIGFLVAFMYTYGLYKGLGREALTVYQEGAVNELSEKVNRTFLGMVLGDLARADIQAFLLYRLVMPDRDYSYSWGRTYVGAVALLIPRSMWPDRPAQTSKEGTEAQHGVGSYDEEEWVSSRVYGLAGETMLNFGPAAVPLAYLIFGVIVGRLQRVRARLHREDARLLLYPFVVNVCFTVLFNDSYIVLFMLVKDGLMPVILVWCGSRALCRAKARDNGRSSLSATPITYSRRERYVLGDTR
jgi:hypothetical protein